MLAEARHTLADFEGLQFQLIQVNNFAPLAESAFHQQPCQGLVCLVRRRKVDVPEIRSRFREVNRIQKAGRFLVDFRDHARSRGFYLISLYPPQRNLLSRRQLFFQPQNSSIAAH